MKIRIYETNIAPDIPQEKVHEIDIDENLSVQDMLDTIKCGFADLSDYYPLSGVFSWNDGYFPYIFTGRRILFNVPFRDASVSDFLKTHNILGSELHIVTRAAQAGGPGFLPWEEIWDMLNKIAIICTISGVSIFSVKSFFDRIRSRFVKRNVSPHALHDILFSRSCWNHNELAELLDMPLEETKYLLKGFGYVYDRKTMMYVPGEHAPEIKEKIQGLQVHDIY